MSETRVVIPVDEIRVREIIKEMNTAALDDVVRLRSALIQAGRAAGCILADDVSTDFLMLVPAEVEAKIAALRAPGGEV